MKKTFLHIIATVFFFVYTLTLYAQNLGITTPGSTNYPQTTVGNTLTEASSNAGNFLIFNPVTTPCPLLPLPSELTAMFQERSASLFTIIMLALPERSFLQKWQLQLMLIPFQLLSFQILFYLLVPIG